ncbi:MAG: type I-B CRISPR-associated endonuclease Cas1 [Candidatus Diapherotrites archaeon]|nr:type I-B CRISPR-associated endonuclease Cas1 [Candidatus Diapherotrites archaeon]
MKRVLYLFTSGKLLRMNNTLVFEKEDKKRVHLPVEQTDSIYVFGELDLNKRVLEFLTKQQIILHFFNRYDYYSGTYYPREHLNSGFLILEQANFYNDMRKRFGLAKLFIRGSMDNMLSVLNYYNRRGKSLERQIENLKKLKECLEDTQTIDEAMAIEGNFRDLYYKCFDKIISDKSFEFVNRSRRPPLNRINALISFGNSVLYTTVLGEIYRTHLDPRIGFLHATNFRSFSLNLDVAEIFKPIIVDRLIFSLINKKQVQAKHFAKHLDGIYMNDKGKEIFVRAYDEKLKSTFKHPRLKRNVSYRYLIRLELYKIEKHIIGEKEYTPWKG